MDKANRLLPCPFCGAPADSYHGTERTQLPDGSYQGQWIVDCSLCDANIESFFNEEDAVAAWNNRANQSPVQCIELLPPPLELIEMREAIRKAWSFDDDQQHTHSWHDREDFLQRQFPSLLDNYIAEANAVIAELVEALEAAIAYIGGNSVVGNQFLDLLEATQSRARAYTGKAGG